MCVSECVSVSNCVGFRNLNYEATCALLGLLH